MVLVYRIKVIKYMYFIKRLRFLPPSIFIYDHFE